LSKKVRVAIAGVGNCASSLVVVNCIPVFIASRPEWQERFAARGLPIIGDDIKSQVGATITHRVLTRLFRERGVKLALERGIGGPLLAPSAYLMKSPPQQYTDDEARELIEEFIAGSPEAKPAGSLFV